MLADISFFLTFQDNLSYWVLLFWQKKTRKRWIVRATRQTKKSKWPKYRYVKIVFVDFKENSGRVRRRRTTSKAPSVTWRPCLPLTRSSPPLRLSVCLLCLSVCLSVLLSVCLCIRSSVRVYVNQNNSDWLTDWLTDKSPLHILTLAVINQILHMTSLKVKETNF